MTTMQKKAYRYDVLAQLDETLNTKILQHKWDVESYKESLKDNPENEFYKKELDEATERIKVIEAIRKDLEKL